MDVFERLIMKNWSFFSRKKNTFGVIYGRNGKQTFNKNSCSKDTTNYRYNRHNLNNLNLAM